MEDEIVVEPEQNLTVLNRLAYTVIQACRQPDFTTTVAWLDTARHILAEEFSAKQLGDVVRSVNEKEMVALANRVNGR